ncbi:MAG: hypothetical protein A2512_12225 [Deltaproteobacteria bacterium RIFOXYD12_FULL_56_24]|nr:MAG: hypothetical protein A2512_12225 [Deltaproteobacteria bacterium RIFOXYD12_FULL_56_24]
MPTALSCLSGDKIGFFRADYLVFIWKISSQMNAVSFQQSAFSNQLSAISFQQSAFSNQLSAISFQQLAFSLTCLLD